MMKTTKRKYTKHAGGALVKKEVDLPEKASTGIATVATVDPQALLSQAIAQGLPEVSMRELFAMRREMEAERAKKEYFKALVGFQHECPVVEKTHEVPNKDKKTIRYRYAPLEDVVTAVQPFLEKWGFSWTVKPSQKDGMVKASCYAHHKDGHEELTEFEVPLDADAYMSNPQKAAAALTFARRYAFINAFGIVTKGEDNDAQQDDEPRRRPIQEPRAKPDEAVPTHAEVKQTDYDHAMTLLKSTSTDPKTKQVVRLFTENEVIDYTHQAGQVKDDPAQMKVILDDIIATGKVRHKAVKGEA
jgi:hypothetical protein